MPGCTSEPLGVQTLNLSLTWKEPHYQMFGGQYDCAPLYKGLWCEAAASQVAKSTQDLLFTLPGN